MHRLGQADLRTTVRYVHFCSTKPASQPPGGSKGYCRRCDHRAAAGPKAVSTRLRSCLAAQDSTEGGGGLRAVAGELRRPRRLMQARVVGKRPIQVEQHRVQAFSRSACSAGRLLIRPIAQAPHRCPARPQPSRKRPRPPGRPSRFEVRPPGPLYGRASIQYRVRETESVYDRP